MLLLLLLLLLPFVEPLCWCVQGGEGGGGGDEENKFDEFMGSDAGVFAGGQYDEDDREADQIWESVDNFMDERRRVSVVHMVAKTLIYPRVEFRGFEGQAQGRVWSRC